MVATVKNFGDVWFNKASLANILSLSDVRKQCRVTMDTNREAAILVHRKDGNIMKFIEYESSLYYYDADNNNSKNNKHSNAMVTNAYLFLNTVKANKLKYTQIEIDGADRARALYRKLGHPSEYFLQHILRNNFVRNCPVTVDDAKRAINIYGPEITTIRGKTTKQQNSAVPNYQPTLIPAPILLQYKNVRLFIDIFWVCGNPYLHSISEWIKFRTISAISDRSEKTLTSETQTIISFYAARGINIVRVEGDHEFRTIKKGILPTEINIADADDHVAEVERSIRTIKERVRCLLQGLPFRRVPKIVIRSAVECANRTLNQFPVANSASKTLSPLTIMTGRPNTDYNDLKIEFGAYAHVFESNDPTNTMHARTTGAIALGLTGNNQGGYYFMSLTTGRRLSRQQWNELPMPDGVVQRVENMARVQKQPIFDKDGPNFEWSPGIKVDENDNDMVMDEEEYNFGQINEEDDVESIGEEPDIMVPGEESDDEIFREVSEEEQNEESINDEETEESFEGDEEYSVQVSSEDEGSPETENIDYTIEEETEALSTANRGGYNLRANREPNYNRFNHTIDNPDNSKSYGSQFLLHHAKDETEELLTGFIFSQMSARAGIQKHGQPAIDALYIEFEQLHNKGVFMGKHQDELTREQKRNALRVISVIKEKRCGKLKGRTVADGRPQHALYHKMETSSPTVSTNALVLSLMIDAYECRDVATADVEGAYLHADQVDFTLVRLEGQSVDIMCKINEGYRSFVSTEGNKKILYLQLMKALYGCVKSALLWYELFTHTLEEMGFELNPYDTCIANKIIEGKQCTIAWYVDDNKISHDDPKVVSDIIKKIELKFGKMTVTRGNEHVFLGMHIRFNKNKTITICMKDYVNEAISVFGEEITKVATTPAQRDLFEQKDKQNPLPETKKDLFHSVVAKLLYISLRGRPDIELAVAYLCTRVSCSTQQDWLKLKRVLQYLYGTVDDTLILGADNISTVRIWVDASYAVHKDMKSHTGGVISFGRGAIMSKSSKQKINTKSSTEAELVGASDYLPHAIWAKKFMSAQGYDIEHSILYQDNQSAMKIENNGRRSCGQQSRHIDIRYFFIKDRLCTDNIKIQYCATEQMLADFFTKPLQGYLFKRLCAVVMGHQHIDTLTTFMKLASQERVGIEDLQEINRDANTINEDILTAEKNNTRTDTDRRTTYVKKKEIARAPAHQ